MNRDGIARICGKIERAVQEFSMLPADTPVIVGFSGGADSTALLHYLAEIRNVPVTAAHINHQLRGEESQRDERWAQAFCEARGIPVRVHREDVERTAREHRQSVEERGRQVRYAFFQELAGPAGRIATAHTASDQVETVLYHLAKGTGHKGMQGIPPVRGNIVRPLCFLTREEVEAYCRWYGLDYVQDSTNFCREYTRNRIRLDVLPLLREINPKVEQAVLRLTGQLREEEEYLQGQAEKGLRQAATPLGYRVDDLRELPPPLQARALEKMVREAGEKQGIHPPRLSEEKIRAMGGILRKGMGKVSLGKGFSFCAEQGVSFLILGNLTKKTWRSSVFPPQTFSFFGKLVRVSLRNCTKSKNEMDFHNLLFHNAVDYDTIASDAIWRNRREGDFFSPCGRGITKPLKKLLNEAHILPSRRDQILLLESCGKIAWLEGFGPAQGHEITGHTRRALQIQITEGTAP